MTSSSRTLQGVGQQLGAGLKSQGPEFFLLPFQVIEKFPLGLGGADLHQLPVVHDELEDVGLDPERGVVRQLDAPVGIELLDGVHQADVAFLDQVQEVLHPIFLELQGDLDHQAEIAGDQMGTGLLVAGFMIAAAEGLFFLRGQQGKAVRLPDVALHQVQVGGNGKGGLGFRLLFLLLHLRLHLRFQDFRQLFRILLKFPARTARSRLAS